MMLITGSDTSINYQCPTPVFISGHRSLSTKKSRSTPKFAPPPRKPIKSSPVSRIFSRVTEPDLPQPVSFREDSDTSFIVHSAVYSPEKSALYFEQCYVIEEKLGVGSFGEVFRVRSKEDGQQYACKRTLLKYRGEGDRRRRMEEVQKHEALPKHRNCVQFFRAWEERQHLYLLTEVCRTSLADMAEDKHDMPESVVWEYLVDLLQGVNHLHAHGLVHMDIKPENIFIGFDCLCKLGDFGLVIDTSQGPVKEALEGDPKYMAPELMNLNFGPPADIFSLGMTILELATDLDLPRQGDTWQLLRQGRLPPAASCLSKELQLVLMGLLSPDPHQRLTAKQALVLPSVRRVFFYKYIKDCFRSNVRRIRDLTLRMWMYIVVVFSFLVMPIHLLRKLRASKESHNTSKFTHSESDFTMGFSDDEGLDDHSLAQPLADVSTSSSEINVCVKHLIGNSTPIGSQPKKSSDFIVASPTSRYSFNESLGNDDSPLFIRRRSTLNRSERPVGPPGNKLQSLSHSHNGLASSRRSIPIDEDPLPSFNLTSKNLLDLFNAAESDDDDD